MSLSELTSLAHWAIFLGTLDAQHHFSPIATAWQRFGFSATELHNSLFTDWIHPDDVTATQHALSQLYFGKPVVTFQNRWLDAQQQYHWLFWSAQLSEHTIHVAAIEILENKMLNDFHQTVLETLPVGILLHEADGTISNCNPYIEELFGISADTLLGQKIWQVPTIYEDGSVVTPEKLPANISLNSGEMCQNVVLGVYKPNDELTWLSCNSQPLWFKHNTHPDAVVSSFVNITDYQLKIDELRDKLTLLSCIFDNIDIGIAMTDALGRFVRVNTAYCRLYGYQLDELIGQPFALLLPPSVRIQAMQHHTAFLAGHNDSPSFWVLQHRDGKIIKQVTIESRVTCSDGRQFKITLVLPDKPNSENTQQLEPAFNLIDSNLWVQKLLKQLPVTVLCLDREGKIIIAQGEQLHSFALNQNSLGKSALLIKTLAPFHDAITQALQGKMTNKTVAHKGIALETHYQAVMEDGKWIGILMILHDITAQRLYQMRHHNIQHELEFFLPHVNVGIIYSEHEKITQVNSKCCEILGYSEAELLAQPLTQLHPDFAHIQLHATTHKKSHTSYQTELAIRTQSDKVINCKLICKSLPPRRIVWLLEPLNQNGIFPDTTADLQEILNQLQDAVLLLDQDFRIQYANLAMEQLSGFSQQELLQNSLQNLDKNRPNSTFYEYLKNEISEQKQLICTLEQRHKHGKIYTCQLKLTVQTTEKHLTYLAVLQARSESQLFDCLTGLPLRPLFNFTLQKNLARAQRHQKHFAVLLVNIENRREVRHRFGDIINDQWIQTLAGMLKTTVRDCDTVAWDGEQQFIVLLEEITQAKDAGLVGQMILFKLTQPLKFAENEVHGEINIGIAIYPQDHNEAESLVQMAEIALERARKQGGGGQCCFHNPQLQY